MCAYLLARETGNVLFCRSEHHADHRHIQELGGITHQWHEAAPGLARIKQMFGSKLVCHRLAEERVSKFSSVDITFETREVHLGDIEVIPTPGHTPGSTCVRIKSPLGKTYLFAGDTLFPSRGCGDPLIVLVDKGQGRFEPRAVQLGRHGAGYVEIRPSPPSGLAPISWP
jgi:hydroxyacylglutathione hydrolase